MNNTASAATVQVTSDTGSLLRLLARTFSSKHVVLAELLQNGRRAGATRIEVEVTDDTIVVRDNGCGIQDFSLLLAVVKSGWNEAVMREDSPYGCGFLGSLFVCDRLVVKSNGGLLSALTEDLIDLKPVGLETAWDTGATVVMLEGHRLGKAADVLPQLRRYCEGFPVRVWINGEEARRPHATDVAELIETPIGLASPALREGASPAKFYLQGIPVQVEGYHGGTNGAVVHLDPKQFLGQAPDRSQLLEASAASAKIKAALRQLKVEHLTELASRMPAEDFLAAHADLAVSLDMREVLNGFDCIPASWLLEFYDTPSRTPPFHEAGYKRRPVFDGTTATIVTREQIQARGLVRIDSYNGATGCTDLLARHAAHVFGFLVERAQSIPSWHWAAELRRTITPGDFKLVAPNERKGHEFEVWGDPANVVLVDTLAIQPVQPLFGHTEARPIELYYDPSEGELFLTPDASAWTAVRNVTDFVGEDERYEDEQEDDYANRLHLIVQSLLETDPAKLLQALVNEHVGHRMPAALKGGTFRVVIAEDGAITVEKA